MSLRIDFNFYDDDGNIVHKEVPLCTISTYDQYRSLNAVHHRFFEAYNHPMIHTRIKEKHRYASPTHIPSYMFDLKDGSLLPNRFHK